MFKQSLLALTLSVLPFAAYPFTINTVWEAQNVIQNAIEPGKTFDRLDRNALETLIEEKSNESQEIQNLECILKNAEQTLLARQKICISTGNLKTINKGTSALCGITALLGTIGSIGAVECCGLIAALSTLRILAETYPSVKNRLDSSGILAKNGFFAQSNNPKKSAELLKHRKDCLILAGATIVIAGASFALAKLFYEISEKIERSLAQHDKTEENIRTIRKLMEYLRYRQGISTSQANTQAA